MAGALYGLNFSTVAASKFKFDTSILVLVFVVLGGIGNTAGAVLGGLLIGFIEIVIVALFPALSGYRDAFAFVVLILVLLVKPTGLLGEKTTEKV